MVSFEPRSSSLNPKPQFDYARTVRSVDITMGFTIIKTIVLEIQIRENPVFSQEWLTTRNIFSHMSDESPDTLLVDEILEYPEDTVLPNTWCMA